MREGEESGVHVHTACVVNMFNKPFLRDDVYDAMCYDMMIMAVLTNARLNYRLR